MATKRPSDALVAYSEIKRSKNELVAITNRDKALLEAVSLLRLQRTFSLVSEYCLHVACQAIVSTPNEMFPSFLIESFSCAGSSTNIEFALTDNVIGGP